MKWMIPNTGTVILQICTPKEKKALLAELQASKNPEIVRFRQLLASHIELEQALAEQAAGGRAL